MKNYIFPKILCLFLCEGTFTYASVDYHDGNVSNFNFTNSEYNSYDFSGSNFSGVTATATTFSSLSVKRNYSNSNFSSANLKEAIFNYADLSNVVFTSSILYDAYFISAVLSGVDFSGADVRRVDFSDTTQYGFTASQLYSTQTYAQGDLQRMSFQGNLMSDWNFSSKDLTRTDFSFSSLVNSDLRNATLTNSIFYSTVLSGVDFRGATGLSFSNCTTTNTILADGSISGGSLNLSGSDSLFIVRPSDTSAVKVTASGGVTDGASLVFRDISSSSNNAEILVSGNNVELNLSQASIEVYFSEDFAPTESIFITLAESSDGATIVVSGLDKSNVKLFNFDGTPFEGSWDLSASENSVELSVYIPESAMWSILPLSILLCVITLSGVFKTFFREE